MPFRIKTLPGKGGCSGCADWCGVRPGWSGTQRRTKRHGARCRCRATGTATYMSIIPRIDLTESEAEVVVKLRAACRTSGFFYLLGHGVDEQLLADALALSRDFFALPEEEKRRAYHLDGHELSAAPAFRGYARSPARVEYAGEEGGREMPPPKALVFSDV
jgi:hypothetical protein